MMGDVGYTELGQLQYKIMKTLFRNISRFFNATPKAGKWLALTILCIAAVIGLSSVETEYTREYVVKGTVIAKTQGTTVHKSSSSPHFVLALRLPDGSLKDVYTSFSYYSVTPVGGTWPIAVSARSLGHERPLFDTIQLAALIVLVLGACLSVASSITSAMFDD